MELTLTDAEVDIQGCVEAIGHREMFERGIQPMFPAGEDIPHYRVMERCKPSHCGREFRARMGMGVTRDEKEVSRVWFVGESVSFWVTSCASKMWSSCEPRSRMTHVTHHPIEETWGGASSVFVPYKAKSQDSGYYIPVREWSSRRTQKVTNEACTVEGDSIGIFVMHTVVTFNGMLNYDTERRV